mmetsp:Transcript_69592/g.163623  ORF Transcript_69592/g.163623 Transcript_69592/m.163623 type:complete len:292 (-) Transcript_69592:2222-3097(-)
MGIGQQMPGLVDEEAAAGAGGGLQRHDGIAQLGLVLQRATTGRRDALEAHHARIGRLCRRSTRSRRRSGRRSRRRGSCRSRRSVPALERVQHRRRREEIAQRRDDGALGEIGNLVLARGQTLGRGLVDDLLLLLREQGPVDLVIDPALGAVVQPADLVLGLGQDAANAEIRRRGDVHVKGIGLPLAGERVAQALELLGGHAAHEAAVVLDVVLVDRHRLAVGAEPAEAGATHVVALQHRDLELVHGQGDLQIGALGTEGRLLHDDGRRRGVGRLRGDGAQGQAQQPWAQLR